MPESARQDPPERKPADDDSRDRSRRGPRIRRRDRRPETVADRLVLKHGSMNAALKALITDNVELEEANDELSTENETLKAKQPAKDSIILTGDDVKKWEKVKGIALDGDKIVARVAKADELEAAKAKDDLSTKRKDVAKKANINGDVLDPLLTQFGLDVELRPITIVTNGKTETKDVAHIRKAGDDKAPWEPLTDFVAKDGSPLKPFATALAVTAQQTNQNNQNNQQNQNNQNGGFVFPDQSGRAADSGSSSIVDRMLKQNDARANAANPLTRPRPTEQAKAS